MSTPGLIDFGLNMFLLIGGTVSMAKIVIDTFKPKKKQDEVEERPCPARPKTGERPRLVRVK